MIQHTKFLPLFQGTISGDEKENMKTMEIKEKAMNLGTTSKKKRVKNGNLAQKVGRYQKKIQIFPY